MATKRELDAAIERAEIAEAELSEFRSQVQSGSFGGDSDVEVGKLRSENEALREERDQSVARANRAEQKLSDLKSGKVTKEQVVSVPDCIGQYDDMFSVKPSSCRSCNFHKQCKDGVK